MSVSLHQRRPNSGCDICDTFSMFFDGNVLGFGGRFLREVSLFKQFIQVSHRVEIHPSEAAKALGFCWDYAEATLICSTYILLRNQPSYDNSKVNR